MDRKKTLRDRLSGLTYMQTAAGFFALSLVLTGVCIWRAVATGGAIGWGITLAGFLAFAAAAAGAGVTLYGHFSVGMDSKTHWLWGLIPNAVLAALFIILYIIGIID